MKLEKSFQSKVVIRRLPPTMTEEQFVEQISPLPELDYMYFVKADLRLGSHAFSRAYINFVVPEDIFIFTEKFDGYVFIDAKGNEYPAIVEFSPFQKIPKKRGKKKDAKAGTIENDPDYLKFIEKLKNPDEVTLPSAEAYLEEIENREKELKSAGASKMTTPLIEYLKVRKLEQQRIREERREERKRKEMEKKRIREEERKKRKAEREKTKEKVKEEEVLSDSKDNEESTPAAEKAKPVEPIMQVLKNPEREKEQKTVSSSANRDYYVTSKSSKEKDRPKREWERSRPNAKEKFRAPVITYYGEKDKSRKDKSDYKMIQGSKCETVQVSRVYSSKRPDVINAHKEFGRSSQYKDISRRETKDRSKSDADLEAAGTPKENRSNSFSGSSESAATENTEEQENSRTKGTSKAADTIEDDESDAIKNSDTNTSEKDSKYEKRIRNKDRPSIAIYRPGMRRFSSQRSSPHKEAKEVSTSASNSSSPSPTPSLANAKSNKKSPVEDSDDTKDSDKTTAI